MGIWDSQTSGGGGEPPIAPGTTGQYWRGDKTWQMLDKTAVGLANVDNTSDVNKPVSTAQAAAIAAAVAGKLSVGGSVSTFADLPVASSHNGEVWYVQTNTGVYLVNRKNKGYYYSDGSSWTVWETDALAQDIAATLEPAISAGTTGQYWRGDKSWQTLNKSAVGLANVDNTSDVNKPVSTAQETRIVKNFGILYALHFGAGSF